MAASGESTMQRTFSVIEYMSGQRRKVSLQEIAEALSLSGAAVQRLLKGLMDLGYAEQDENKRYYLSYKIYKVAGKLFLAQMEPDALVEWLARERIVPHTRNTIIDRDELLREIDRTRAQGYGVVVGELYDLIACVAFPVHDGSGAITGTLNLSFTVEDFKRHMGEDFVKEVEDTLKSFGI